MPPQQESDDFENGDNISQNANLNLANSLDLHTAMEPPAENNNIAESVHQQQQESEAVTYDVLSEARAGVHAPGHLPEFSAVDMPPIISWGHRADGTIITVHSSTIIKAYDEITQWRKNTFLVPYGKVGREFIDQLTQHITEWNNASHAQHIALKAAIVLLATVLQKPSMKSKAKDHQECLTKRLALWKEGEIESLLREGRSIQKRILKTKRAKPPDKAKIFAKLVMQGQINSALRYLSEDNCRGVLPLTDDVMRQLHEKHPEAQDAKLGSILFGPVEEVHDSLYQQIDGEMIREAALRTKGSGGPSGVDANGFKRILTCKSFKKSSANLCDALATMTRKLCTEYIDPRTIEPILANRLIPLDKGEGAVRPIGVGEVIRRIIGKCVMRVTKEDVLDASGSLQVCAGLRSGSEAAVHAMYSIFEEEETDAVLLIDASNAFNALNRAAALHNIRVLCPPLATYAINTYRQPARLFITGGSELKSAEGTTQGDPLAMAIYAISLQPLITRLGISSEAKQCWYADDASGSGSLEVIKQWWDELTEVGPNLGYYPNAKKCWLITKPEKVEGARAIFEGTAINISTQGQSHLGAALGSREYLEEYVGSKVEDWVVRLGGLGIINPSQDAGLQYQASMKTTAPLVENIVSQVHETPDDTVVSALQQSARREKNEVLRTRLHEIKNSLTLKTQRAVELASDKGASNWLTVIPIDEMGFTLNKGEFRDALKLRYDWEIADKPSICVCGDVFNVDHAMVCRRGGFIIQRHNELRDLEADMLSMVCNDVEIEPVLQELTGESLPSGANRAPDARLDIHARGFWERQRSAFFDVRVCHPNADSYRDLDLKQIYKQHENDKKRLYTQRVMNVEQGTFTPLVFTTTGGMGEECKRYHNRLAELVAAKKGEVYANTVSWIRSKVSFAILRAALLCLRGSRTPKRTIRSNVQEADFELDRFRAKI